MANKQIIVKKIVVPTFEESEEYICLGWGFFIQTKITKVNCE